MKGSLIPGMMHSHTFTVTEQKTVPALYPEDPHFSRMPKVFATGFLVGLVEITCMQALDACLEEGEGSVGIHVDLSHSAPTPPGMAVKVEIAVKEVVGRKVTWDVLVKDEKEIICEGTHQRFVVEWERFGRRVDEKRMKK